MTMHGHKSQPFIRSHLDCVLFLFLEHDLVAFTARAMARKVLLVSGAKKRGGEREGEGEDKRRGGW